MVDNLHGLSLEKLPGNALSGCTFKAVQINPVLPWLIGQCKTNGVAIDHIAEAATPRHTCDKAVIIINLTGLLSCKLRGVMDEDVIPACGQVVIVRNKINRIMAISGTYNGKSELCYVMTRSDCGGTVVGGTYELGNWSPEHEPNQAVRTMSRIFKLVPEPSKAGGILDLDIATMTPKAKPIADGRSRC